DGSRFARAHPARARVRTEEPHVGSVNKLTGGNLIDGAPRDSSLRLPQRQLDFERASAANFALDPDLAAVRVHNPLADCQPQPRSTIDSPARRICSIEAFEQMRQVFG